VFGNVRVCRHRVGDQRARWVAALCGVCVAVGEAAGHLPRALLVTDAAALAALTAETAPHPVGVTRAGPCPLRGMRSATVLAPDDRATRVGVAAALLSAWVRLEDAVRDGDAPAGRAGRTAARAAARRLRPRALAAAAAADVDLPALHDALRRSAEVETGRPSSLDAWCAPAEDATAAVVAGLRSDVLTDVARGIGRATLLADAVGDVEADRRAGRPNPLLAGAADRASAIAEIRRTAHRVAADVAAACGAGSLSAVLWGPCWSAGLRRAQGHGGVHGGRHAHRQHAASTGRTRRPPRPSGGGPLSAVAVVAAAAALSDPVLPPGFTWSGVADDEQRRQQAQAGCGDCGSCDCACCCDGLCCCDGGCCDGGCCDGCCCDCS
jgi:hypothetical protein